MAFTGGKSRPVSSHFIDRPGTFIIPNPWDAGRRAAGVARLRGAGDDEPRIGHHTRSWHRHARRRSSPTARPIADATDLPVNADLENCGAHEPKAAAKMIRLASDAGMVGGSIEDCDRGCDRAHLRLHPCR